MVSDAHKRADQSAYVRVAGCLRGTRIGSREETYTMITRHRASGPIIVICFNNDVDVGEARNLARRNVGIIFQLANKLIKFISMSVYKPRGWGHY